MARMLRDYQELRGYQETIVAQRDRLTARMALVLAILVGVALATAEPVRRPVPESVRGTTIGWHRRPTTVMARVDRRRRHLAGDLISREFGGESRRGPRREPACLLRREARPGRLAGSESSPLQPRPEGAPCETETPRPTLTLVASTTAKSDKIDLVKAKLVKLLDITRAEAGCLRYDLHQQNENPTPFLFFENWESRDLWQAHMKARHRQDYLAATKGAVAELTLNETTQIGYRRPARLRAVPQYERSPLRPLWRRA